MSPALSSPVRTKPQAALDLAIKAKRDLMQLRERDPSSALILMDAALDRIVELLRGKN